MNRQPFAKLRRIAAAIGLLTMMAVALPAAASDQPLPVPQPASDIIVIIPLYPEPVSPTVKAEINVNGSFQWTNVGALKYTIKFKNMRTGLVISHTTPGICSEYCWLSEASVGLRTTYRDGDVFTWQVVAKMEGGLKFKSSKAKATFNEVDTAALINPAKDGIVTSGYGFAFRWSDSPLAAKYTIIVRDAETGTVAFKASGERLDWCELVCSVGLYSEARSTLEYDRSYTWMIKTVGMTGEKAKSAPSMFKWLAPQVE